jgi:hypothetical protein
VNVNYKKEMWSIVYLSHIKNLRNNSYGCSIYIYDIKKLRNNACNVAIYSYPISKKFKNNACGCKL